MLEAFDSSANIAELISFHARTRPEAEAACVPVYAGAEAVATADSSAQQNKYDENRTEEIKTIRAVVNERPTNRRPWHLALLPLCRLCCLRLCASSPLRLSSKNISIEFSFSLTKS